jgi:hypothetical protein
LLKNSKCSESLQTGRERRPRRCEPNATRFVSNGRREREILQSVHKVKQAKKKMMLTVQSVQADVAEPYDRTCGDVASILLVDSWSNGKSTRGTVWGK